MTAPELANNRERRRAYVQAYGKARRERQKALR